MATVKFERVVSYSSEDPKFPAENLLTFGKKWKCKNPGEVNATVILQLDQPHVIETLDIGNEHSAFVHVLVGRAASDDYESLLPAASFMSPLESDQSTNTNRVRMFTRKDFLQSIANEKWDRLKIVCTQPFNKRVQYGLSFIVVKRTEDKPEPVIFGQSNLKEENKYEKQSVNLGRFRLKEESDDDAVTAGSWFAKWKERVESDKKSAVNGSSLGNSGQTNPLRPVLTPAQQKTVAKKVVRRGSNGEGKEIPNIKATNFQKQSHTTVSKIKPKTLPSPRPDLPVPTAETRKTPMGKQNGIPAAQQPTAKQPDNTKRLFPMGPMKEVLAKKPKLSSVKKSRPFKELLEGVTIVISGYVNPARGILRSRALEMGAKYKQDWDSSCTHLICAFRNTPKFKQVQGHGHIVQKDWIDQCYVKRMRLPWRRFALDSNDLKQPESEEEIVEEIVKPSTSFRKSPAPDDLNKEIDTSSGCRAESGSDTEDEIERLEAQSPKNVSYNPYLSDTDLEDEERPDTTGLPMPPL